jgi:hypothetical protein
VQQGAFVAWIEQLVGKRRSKKASTAEDVTAPRAKTLAEQMYSREPVPVGPRLPKFRSTATDQASRRGQSAFDDMRSRLYTVFLASQPVMDRRSFAGRTDVLQKLIRATEDLRLHTVLYGERGLGKTSLLHILAQSAREARYLVIYISCGARSAFDEVVRSVAAQIPLLYCNGISPTSEEVEAGKTFADLLPPGPLSPQIAGEALSGIVGTRVLVILDEFDQCQSKEFRLSVAELLKSLSDRSVRLQFLIAGVAANLTELIEHIPSIQRNIFALQLQRMPAAELRDLIRNGESATGLRFDPDAARGIVQVANGFPYFACLLSCYAGLRALDEGRSGVELKDVMAAVGDAIEQFGGRLSRSTKSRIAAIEESGQLEMLGHLAGVAQVGGGCFEFEDVRTLFPGRERMAECASFVESLTSKKIVRPINDGTETGVFRFVDETAVPYVWLLSVREQLRKAADEPDAGAAAADNAGLAG